MPLPLAPPPVPADVVVLDWAGITVRVAWTLLRLGVRVRRTVLEEARNHVLFHIEPSMTPTAAEDLAEHLTEEFVARAKGRRPSDLWSQDWDMPLSDRWRRAVGGSLDPDAAVVFRKHYGDNRPLDHLANVIVMDPAVLEGARQGLRRVVRELARADRLPISEWPDARIDRLLRRLAAYAPGPCPSPSYIMEGLEKEHARECPRCNRLARLVQSQVLDRAQLAPPSFAARPRQRARVLVLQVHPDGHAYRRALVAELPALAFPVGEELLLLDAENLEMIAPALVVAAEVGSPRAEHVRGALLEGPGSWGEHGLAGPLAEQAFQAVSHQDWGAVAGIGALPDELPAPPSALGAWVGVGGLFAVTVLLVQLAATMPALEQPGGLQVEFTTARAGTWAHFDVPDTRLVSIVARTPQGLQVVLESHRATDKMVFAVGDGTYRTHVMGSGLLIVAHDAPLGLSRLLEAAASSDAPLVSLKSALGDHLDMQLHLQEG